MAPKMKPNVHYVEYPSFDELCKRVENFVYSAKYNGEYVYFIPMCSYAGENWLHFYLSKEELRGYIVMDNDKITVKEQVKPSVPHIPIIEVKNTSFIGKWINEYKTKESQNI